LLVENGANLEVKNKKDQTPLQFAEKEKNIQLKNFYKNRLWQNKNAEVGDIIEKMFKY
jgi:ankyrin repeat protein